MGMDVRAVRAALWKRLESFLRRHSPSRLDDFFSSLPPDERYLLGHNHGVYQGAQAIIRALVPREQDGALRSLDRARSGGKAAEVRMAKLHFEEKEEAFAKYHVGTKEIGGRGRIPPYMAADRAETARGVERARRAAAAESGRTPRLAAPSGRPQHAPDRRRAPLGADEPSPWDMLLPDWLGDQDLRLAKAKATRARKAMEGWSPAQYYPVLKVPAAARFAGRKLEDVPLWFLEKLYSNRGAFKNLPSRVQRALEQVMKNPQTRARRAEAAEPREYRGGGWEKIEGYDRDYWKRAPGDFAVSDVWPDPSGTVRSNMGTDVRTYEPGMGMMWRGSRTPADYAREHAFVSHREELLERNPERREFRRLFRSAMFGRSTVTGEEIPSPAGWMRPLIRQKWEAMHTEYLEADRMDMLEQRKMNPREAGPAGMSGSRPDAETRYDMGRMGMREERPGRMHDFLGRFEMVRTTQDLQHWEDEMDTSYPLWRLEMPNFTRQYLLKLNALRGAGE